MGRETIDEFVVHLRIDDDAIGTHADLTLVQESADDRRTDRLVEIGIIENDAGCVAAQFEGDAFEVAFRSLEYLLAHSG